MNSMSEKRGQHAREVRPYMIFLAFVFSSAAGGAGRVITGGFVPALVAVVVMTVVVIVTEVVLRKVFP